MADGVETLVEPVGRVGEYGLTLRRVTALLREQDVRERDFYRSIAVAVAAGMAGGKAIDKSFPPVRDRDALHVPEDPDDAEWPPPNGALDGVDPISTARFEDGEADDWLATARASWTPEP